MPSQAITSAGTDRVRRRRRPLIGAALAATLCIAALSSLALHSPARLAASPPSEDRFDATPLSASWQVVPDAPALVAAGALSSEGRRESHLHAGSGLREESFLLGSFEDAAQHVSMTLERGPLPVQRLGLFVDMTRRAAPAGLAVVRMGQIETLPTKLGDVEAAPVSLAGARERQCLAFRWSEQELGLKGWLCSTDPATARADLVCFIDRISASEGADRALRTRLSQADARRSPTCRTSQPGVARRPAPAEATQHKRNAREL